MNQVTGLEVYEALLLDKQFSSQPLELIELQKPIIIQMPDFLSDLLDEKVTFIRLYEARIRFMEKCEEFEVVKNCIMILPEDSLRGMGTKEELIEQAQKKVNSAIVEIKEYLHDVQEELSSSDRSDELMFRGIIGLKSKVRQKHKDGTLTFADLLLLQPALIVYS